jgi:SNF2 family DNA or RNA helicase
MPYLTMSPATHNGRPRLDVRTEWSDKELVRDCPGTYWDAKRRTWHCPRTLAALYQMRAIFGPRLDYDDEVEAWARPERDRMEYARWLSRALQPAAPVPGVEGLYPWQHVDLEWGWTVLAPATEEAPQGGLLGNDQGTGKTVSTAVLARLLAGLGDALPALVICPNSVVRVWRDELPRWFPDCRPYIVRGTAAVRQRLIAQALADPAAVMVINYEGVRSHSRLAPYGSTRLKRCAACGGARPDVVPTIATDDEGRVLYDEETMEPITVDTIVNAHELVKPAQCHVHPREFNGAGIRTVVVDEAQALADPSSQQTRACWAVCHDPSVTRRLATTGTPISNNMTDLFGIMHAVQPDEYPVRSGYIGRYGQQVWNAHGGYDVKGFRQDNAPELFAFLDPRYRRVTKAQAAPWLPPKVRTRRLVQLPPKMRKAYDEMDRRLITRLEDGTVLLSASALTQTTRLIQLSSSYGTVETVEEWDPQAGAMGTRDRYLLRDPSPKIDELLQVLSERGSERPLACYAVSKQLINMASARLAEHGVPHGLITGDQHHLERDRALDDFQAGRLAVLLFNDAGSTGLTMTAADTILRLQRSWSILRNLQVEDRAHRIGSEVHAQVDVMDVIAEDTVEEDQLLALLDKLEYLEQLRRDGVDIREWVATNGDDLRDHMYKREVAA